MLVYRWTLKPWLGHGCRFEPTCSAYALEALDKQAVAYLLKPVREEKLRTAIERAGRVNRLQLSGLDGQKVVRTHVVSESGRGVESAPLTEVRCFIAEQKYVRAVHPAGSLLIQDTLKELEQVFGALFFRVHRNALVAVRHIAGLRRDNDEGWWVELEGVDEQPAVSRRHLADLKDLMRRR